MRNVLALLLALSALWSIDVVVLDGRCSQAVWEETGVQGKILKNDVQRWLKQRGFTSAIRPDGRARGV